MLRTNACFPAGAWALAALLALSTALASVAQEPIPEPSPAATSPSDKTMAEGAVDDASAGGCAGCGATRTITVCVPRMMCVCRMVQETREVPCVRTCGYTCERRRCGRTCRGR